MFVLVTQADGSARRITWITYAIAIGLIAFYVQNQAQQRAASAAADQSLQALLAYQDENAYVQVEERFDRVILVAAAEARREAFFKERREQGYALMPEDLMSRAQREFDELLEQGLVDVNLLPVWKLGLRGEGTPNANWIMHFAVHETQVAIVLAIVLLLLLGIAIEDGWGPVLFGFLVVAGVMGTAFASRHLDYAGATGAPWVGAGGLIATLLGAYFVRSSPLSPSPRAFGVIPMPCWLLIT
jgi:membrane associated rhomboid family serine protease